MTSSTSERLTSGMLRGAVVLALALMIGWSPAPAAAQATGTLVGTVRDAATQRPLEAVQVYIGGTGIGALTNAAGRFLLLNVPAGEHTLVAELVGYRSGSQTVTVAAGQSVVADFGLQQTAITLDQIVVTGAGIATEKRKLGNTIATLDASSLENAPISDFSQMIAGREPGLVALPSSGYTGEGARIRIRGSSSLSQLNEPIIYVDGIRVNRQAVDGNNGQGNPSRLDDIPPESIERVEILKGAAAATLYGTEASNGVIQIFTKRGRAGAPSFSAQADWSAISVPTNRMLPVADYIGRDCEEVDCTDPGDAATLAEIQGRMQDRFGVSPGPFEPFEADLIPEMLSTGFNQTYSASVNGGSDAFQYFVSARIADEDGPYNPQQNFPVVEALDVETDTNRRAAFTSNFTVIPNQKIRIGVSTLYSDMEHHTPDNGNNIYGVFSSILMTQLRRATTQSETGEGSNYYGNPAFATTRENMYQQNFVNAQHFAGSANVGFTPTDNFRLDGTFGIDFTSDDAVAFRPYKWALDGFSGSTPDGNRSVEEYRSREITADLKGSLISNFGDNIENTFLFGGQGFLRQNQEAGGSGSVFPGPGLETLSALANEGSFESWTRVTQLGGYLQDQVGINDWVFVTLGGRWDANSAFGEDFSTAFYPKASISIVPSQGLDWQNETFSTFRVRGAIGQSGLQPDAFAKFTTYSPAPSEEGPGVQPSNLGNDALQPEVSTEWEIGAEVGLFNDRWSVDATYWDRTVSDALVARQFSVTGGFTAEQLVNIGELVGSGFEVSLRGTALQREGFSLNVFANTAYLSEEITSLGGAPPLKTGGSYPRYRNFLVEGYTPGAFFGATTADVPIPLNLDGSCTVPSEADALAYFATPRSPSDFKPLAPANSDFGEPISGQYSSNNCGEGLLLSYLGKPTPDFAGSFGFNMSFAQNFELNTLFEYKQGIQNQDLSGMFRRANAVIGRNTPRAAELGSIMGDPTSSAQQRLDAAVAWANEIEGLSPMSGMNGVYDAGLIRFRELSLTYRIPSDIVEGWGLSTATLNLGARNVHMWIFGDYTGMDPETNVIGRCNGGLDCNFLNSTEGWSIPIPRRFTLSTRVTF
ncbi:MAG: SusC/RagA family TonB-linked outer membrane protein [Gemmatimonadota bacterium]|nr:SusC/RagA family TonB-linked outer membrane protein [Gemmatimonadota bacterium]